MIDNSVAREIVDELYNKRIFAEDKIVAYIESTKKIASNLDWIKILSLMVNDKFSYVLYVGKKLIECATSDPEYVELIIKLCQNDKFAIDLAKLIELYDKDPNVAEFVYNNLLSRIDDTIALAIGYIIGGMGHTNPEKLFSLIDVKTISEPHKIAYLFGLQIASEKQKLPKNLFEFITSQAKSTNHRIQLIVVNTLVFRYSKLKKVENILLELIKIDDYHKRLVASVVLHMRDNEKLAMKLLSKCSNTDNANVADSIAFSIGRLAPKFPLECMSMIKRWAYNQKFTHRSYDWFIEEIGRGDVKKIESFMLKWLNSEKNYLVSAFHLPDIVCSVYKHKEDELVNLLNNLNFRKDKISTLILKILEKYISEGYKQTHRKESFVSECNNLLIKIALHQSLDAKLDTSITNPIIQTLALIHAIEVKEKLPNTKLAIENLNKFDNIISFFGKKTLESLVTQKPKHPLVWYLANARVTKSQIKKKLDKVNKAKQDWQKAHLIRSTRELAYPFSMLVDIDSSLAMIGKNEQGRGRIKDGILDECDFYQTLTELNVISRLKKKYETVMQPKFGKNLLDAQTSIDGQDCLFEIYSPKEDIRLEHVRTMHGMENKAKKTILSKVDSQIKATTGTNLPVIVVIDRTNARSINEENITDALYGSLGFTWVVNNETHETITTYASRTADSLSHISKHGNLLSAIILLTREFDGNDFRIKLYGKIYPNPNALIQIHDTVIQKIEKSLFGKGVF